LPSSLRQILACPSSPALTRAVESGKYARLTTARLCACTFHFGLPMIGLHSQSIPCSSAAAACWPSGLIATVSRLPLVSIRGGISGKECKSHSLTSPGALPRSRPLPLRSIRPSGLTATARTPLLCPRKQRDSDAPSVSQSFTDLSSLAVATCCPSDRNA